MLLSGACDCRQCPKMHLVHAALWWKPFTAVTISQNRLAIEFTIFLSEVLSGFPPVRDLAGDMSSLLFSSIVRCVVSRLLCYFCFSWPCFFFSFDAYSIKFLLVETEVCEYIYIIYGVQQVVYL